MPKKNKIDSEAGENSRELFFMRKHQEFENVTVVLSSRSDVVDRGIFQNTHGKPQHVVEFSSGALLRWPVSYEAGKNA